jgi:hypothetical protein
MLRGIIPLHGAHETTDCQLTRSSHLQQLRLRKVEEKKVTDREMATATLVRRPYLCDTLMYARRYRCNKPEKCCSEIA